MLFVDKEQVKVTKFPNGELLVDTTLLRKLKDGRTIEVVNEVDTDEQDIIQDFVSIITSFCARLYGKRRSRRKTEQLIEELKCN